MAKKKKDVAGSLTIGVLEVAIEDAWRSAALAETRAMRLMFFLEDYKRTGVFDSKKLESITGVAAPDAKGRFGCIHSDCHQWRSDHSCAVQGCTWQRKLKNEANHD
jgi:hypothetical protein